MNTLSKRIAAACLVVIFWAIVFGLALALALAIGGCDDGETLVPTEDFQTAVQCDDGEGVVVDHGWRGVQVYQFEIACRPRCATTGELCAPGEVFYTVPVRVDSDFPSGNACFCADPASQKQVSP